MSSQHVRQGEGKGGRRSARRKSGQFQVPVSISGCRVPSPCGIPTNERITRHQSGHSRPFVCVRTGLPTTHATLCDWFGGFGGLGGTPCVPGAWHPMVRPSWGGSPPNCWRLLGPLEDQKLLIRGQGHGADEWGRLGAGGDGVGVHVVVRLCLGGRSRSRDLAASAELRRQLNNQLRPHNNKLRPRNNTRQCTWRLGELMVRQDAIRASVDAVRSRDLTASAEPRMAPGTSLLAWKDESSLPPL